MKRVVVFGNSGSGKSTLARQLAVADQLEHLDLDTLAWWPDPPPRRLPLALSRERVDAFTDAHERWVIEGCYADLIEMVLPLSTELMFLNIPVEDCIANAKRRPWERHKYASPEEQDANLPMLLEWIAQYPQRSDEFSLAAHEALYLAYPGKKTLFTGNDRRA